MENTYIIHGLAPRARFLVLALLTAFGFFTGPAMSAPGDDLKATITESVVMFYYKDTAAAVAFYGETLGLETVYAQDSATLFKLTPTSTLGVILEGESSYHRVQPANAVMLSIVSSDVDAWYNRLQDNQAVTVLKPVADSQTNPIRAFLIEDPGGYTVEFFSWLSGPDAEADDR